MVISMNKILDFNHGIHIEKVFLDVPFSSEKYSRMTFMQPFIYLSQQVPFKWVNIKIGTMPSPREIQLANLEHFISLSLDDSRSGLRDSTDFILIPEYAIPGLDGIELIIKMLEDSSADNKVIIGGIDWLTKVEFLNVLGKSSFEPIFKMSAITWIASQSDETWINSVVIFVKNGDKVKFYLQPKLLPSPTGETLTQMLEGKWVLLFETNAVAPIKFIVSVCFDWIGLSERIDNLTAIAEGITSNTRIGNEQWIAFVPQYNRSPSHRNFMEQTRKFLWDNPWARIHGRNAMVIMINSATQNSKEYGQSSIIFQSWISRRIQDGSSNYKPLSTYSMLSRKDLGACNEARFRDNRQCIHAVEVVLPFSSSNTTGEDHYPLRRAIVHTIDGKSISNDPRFPDPPGPVCAYQKVLGDLLDEIQYSHYFKFSLDASLFDNVEKANADRVFKSEIGLYRNWEKDIILGVFNLLCKWSRYTTDCDTWSSESKISLDFFISLRTTLKFAGFHLSPPIKSHGILIHNGRKLSVTIIDLGSSGDYRDIYDNLNNITQEEDCNNKIIITADRSPTPPRSRFTQAKTTIGSFTNPEPILIWANDIFSQTRNVSELDVLKEKLIELVEGGSI